MLILITCEHAVNTIPKEFQHAYAAHQDLLNSHRGYDIGAQAIARHFAEQLQAPYIEATVSRFLIDYNRSLPHPHCLSFISKAFDTPTKEKLAQAYYLPHRQRVFETLQALIQQKKPVLHLAIHSFTPTFQDKKRTADLGLLYDPVRPLEKKLAATWCNWLNTQNHPYHIRRNYPYLGKTDGLATTCRKKFGPELYIGFEVEFNQGTLARPQDAKALPALILQMIQATVKGL